MYKSKNLESIFIEIINTNNKNIDNTLTISILVVSKYKTNRDFIKIVVYFDDTISSFSTKINYKHCC